MLQIIGDTALKYIVEAILAVIVAGVGLLAKRYYKLSKEDRQKGQKEYYAQLTKDVTENNEKLVEAVMKASSEADSKLQAQIDAMQGELGALKEGVLSVQGKEFRAECVKLLADDHVITLDELEEITSDHEAYNKLGGNHRGDQLFDLVCKKAENILTK